MSILAHQDSRSSVVAERQMQTWAHMQEAAAKVVSHRELGPSTAQAIAYVTISREAGAGGTTIAQMVGEQLGWEVYDGNLLDQVAERYKESRIMLDLVDETKSSWVMDVLGTWMDRQIVPHEKFAVQVSRMIQVLARAGNAVFVGRGAQFLLPRSKTFVTRIVAPEAYRVQHVRQQQNFEAREASDWMHRVDRGRHENIQRFFRHDIRDPHLYDLVINAERFGPSGAAEQIVYAVHHMGT